MRLDTKLRLINRVSRKWCIRFLVSMRLVLERGFGVMFIMKCDFVIYGVGSWDWNS